MKNDINLCERIRDRIAITQITMNKFGFVVNPSRLSAPVGLWLQIIKDSNIPLIVYEQIDEMRPNQAGTAGN
jgi:hypothetical protein